MSVACPLVVATVCSTADQSTCIVAFWRIPDWLWHMLNSCSEWIPDSNWCWEAGQESRVASNLPQRVDASDGVRWFSRNVLQEFAALMGCPSTLSTPLLLCVPNPPIIYVHSDIHVDTFCSSLGSRDNGTTSAGISVRDDESVNFAEKCSSCCLCWRRLHLLNTCALANVRPYTSRIQVSWLRQGCRMLVQNLFLLSMSLWDHALVLCRSPQS